VTTGRLVTEFVTGFGHVAGFERGFVPRGAVEDRLPVHVRGSHVHLRVITPVNQRGVSVANTNPVVSNTLRSPRDPENACVQARVTRRDAILALQNHQQPEVKCFDRLANPNLHQGLPEIGNPWYTFGR
jgi:hypothetical protein